MVLCETGMLLFVSVWYYAKPRCYYSCPYGIMRNLDAIIWVSNYVRLNLGLRRAWSLRSGASDKLIMPILPAEWEFMWPSQSCKMAEGSSSSCTPRERAVSLLHVVQNLLKESTEIYFGLPRWPVKSRSAMCIEKERLWKLKKSRTSLSGWLTTLPSIPWTPSNLNCIIQSFDTIKNWFLAISIQIWCGKLLQNLVNPRSKAAKNIKRIIWFCLNWIFFKCDALALLQAIIAYERYGYIKL